MKRPIRLARDLWVAFDRFNRNDGWAMAGYIAFSGLLSLFPFLIFATTLIGILVGTANRTASSSRCSRSRRRTSR